MNGYDKWGRRIGQAEMVISAGGMADFEGKGSHAVGPSKPKAEADTAPPVPMAEKKGAVVILKCRTPGEALLVAAELERENIVAILPEQEAMLRQHRENGFVEVQASAKAYASAADLQAVVEFRHTVIRADQPLSFAGKIGAMLLGVMIVPGLLIYTGLRSSYTAQGYQRTAQELRLWFLMGVLSWVVVVACASLFV